jgi:glycosyltransferase involved in cell wall biosynthesis
MRVTVVIPALNEGGNIRRLVDDIPLTAAEQVTVIVVDNGSTDGTATNAREAGALVVSEPRRGYGYACAAGVAATAPDCDVIVFMDGDGSFDPAELPRLLDPIRRGEADMTLGSRVAGGIQPGAMPPHQLFGNRLVSRLMGLLYGLKITDLGPFRAVRADTLRSIAMKEMTFGWPTEMMVKLARRARIAEVPVSHRKRWSGVSKVSGTLRGTILATYFILGTTLRYVFWRDTRQNPR